MQSRQLKQMWIGTWRIVLAAVMLAAIVRAETPQNADTLIQHVPLPCGSSPTSSVEHRYKVSARVRPLLIWTRRHEVGSAIVLRRLGADVAHLALLIGTDPDRAPLHINRWGYIAEATCGPQTRVAGIMTEADESTIDEAREKVTDPRATHPFKAIRMSIQGGDASSERMTMLRSEDFTYRDLDRVLQLLPPERAPSHMTVPPQTAVGFLTSMDSALHQLASPTRGAKSNGAQGRYVYGGRIYELSAEPGRDSAGDLPAYRAAAPRSSAFAVKNTATGEVTEFQVAYGTAGPLEGAPLRAIYRPHWWIEIQLDREE